MFYKEEFDALTATHQKHETLFVRSRCHTNGGIEVSYKKGSGMLRIACRECHSVIIEVAVAEQNR